MPWAFLPKEITHILSTYTAPKYNHDRAAHREERMATEKSLSDRTTVPLPPTASAQAVASNSSGEASSDSSTSRLTINVKQERESVG